MTRDVTRDARSLLTGGHADDVRDGALLGLVLLSRVDGKRARPLPDAVRRDSPHHGLVRHDAVDRRAARRVDRGPARRSLTGTREHCVRRDPRGDGRFEFL